MRRTATRVVLLEELVERHPAAADAHHYGAAQDAHEAQLLGLAELHAHARRTKCEHFVASDGTGTERFGRCA